MTDEHEHRWEIRLRTGVGTEVLATAGSPQALGLALTTLHEEGQLLGRVGIRDAETSKWIINPFAGNRAVTLNPPVNPANLTR